MLQSKKSYTWRKTSRKYGNGVRSVTIDGVVYPIERDSNNNQFITIDGVVRYETVGGRSKRRRRSSLKRRS